MGIAQRNSNAAKKWAQERKDKIERAQLIKADRALQHKKRIRQSLNIPDDTSAQCKPTNIQPLASTENFRTDQHPDPAADADPEFCASEEPFLSQEENLQPDNSIENPGDQGALLDNSDRVSLSSCTQQLKPSSSSYIAVSKDQSDNRVVRHGRRRKVGSPDGSDEKKHLNEEQENINSQTSSERGLQGVASNIDCTPHSTRESNPSSILKIRGNRPSLIPQLHGKERNMDMLKSVKERSHALPEQSLRSSNIDLSKQQNVREETTVSANSIKLSNVHEGQRNMLQICTEENPSYHSTAEDWTPVGQREASTGTSQSHKILLAATEDQSGHRQMRLDHLKRLCSARRFKQIIEHQGDQEHKFLLASSKQSGLDKQDAESRRNSGYTTWLSGESESQALPSSRGSFPGGPEKCKLYSEGPTSSRRLVSNRFSVHPAIRLQNQSLPCSGKVQTDSELISNDVAPLSEKNWVNNHQWNGTRQSIELRHLSRQQRRLRRTVSENSAKLNPEKVSSKECCLQSELRSESSLQEQLSNAQRASKHMADLGPMKSCSSCGRTFLESSLAPHSSVCIRIFKTKRNIFDSSAARMRGISAEQSMCTRLPTVLKQGCTSVTTTWRQKSQALRSSLSLEQGSKS